MAIFPDRTRPTQDIRPGTNGAHLDGHTNGNGHAPALGADLSPYHPSADAPTANGSNGTNGHHEVTGMPPLADPARPQQPEKRGWRRFLGRAGGAARDLHSTAKARLAELNETAEGRRVLSREQAESQRKAAILVAYDKQITHMEPYLRPQAVTQAVTNVEAQLVKAITAEGANGKAYVNDMRDMAQAILKEASVSDKLIANDNWLARALGASKKIDHGIIALREELLQLGVQQILVDTYVQNDPYALEAERKRTAGYTTSAKIEYRYKVGYPDVLVEGADGIEFGDIRNVYHVNRAVRPRLQRFLEDQFGGNPEAREVIYEDPDGLIRGLAAMLVVEYVKGKPANSPELWDMINPIIFAQKLPDLARKNLNLVKHPMAGPGGMSNL